MSWVEDLIAMRLLDDGVESTPKRAKWDVLGGIVTDDPAGNRKIIQVSTPADVNVTETFTLSGAITPAQLTASVDNYNPTGLADATVLRLSSDAQRFISGLAGGASGRVIKLVNVGSFEIVLSSLNGSSSAANQFQLFPGQTGTGLQVLGLQPHEEVELWYDPTNSKWRVFAERARNVLGDSSVVASTMAADTHDLARSGHSVVILSANAGPFGLTGMTPGTERMLAAVYNSGANTWLIKHDQGSTAAFRFTTPNGVPYPVRPGAFVLSMYSTSSSRWRVISDRAPEPLPGPELTGAAGTPGQTITVDQGAVRMLPGNLAQNSVLDIDNTNAIDDETITIVSLNTAAFTYTLRDHANANLFVIPASTRMAVTLRKVTAANFANPVATRL